MDIEQKKNLATEWFRTLRDDICAEFETIEREYAAACMANASNSSPREGGGREGASHRLAHGPLLTSTLPGEEQPHFTQTSWNRPEGGGGVMSLMKGRVFEKVGVNISTVEGEFSEAFRKEIPGAAKDPRFWAAGISLVAHMASPKIPAAHFNTRMITTGDGARLWFGGGGDLTPMVPDDADTQSFHAAFKRVCDEADEWAQASRASTAMSSRHATHAFDLRAKRDGAQASPVGDLLEQTKKSFYPAFSEWCEEYFFLPHRNEPRGVGGIFYDYLGLNRLGGDTETIAPGQFGRGGLGKERTALGMEVAANAALDWAQAFAFTQQVGRSFKDAYSAIIRRHLHEPWTADERLHQLRRRGRYVEYNLLYDRGTRFGLMTGGNTEAILMSLPPEVRWD